MARKASDKPLDSRPERETRPVRLDLVASDHERLDRHARKRGLSKASLARMIILGWLDE